MPLRITKKILRHIQKMSNEELHHEEHTYYGQSYSAPYYDAIVEEIKKRAQQEKGK